MIPVQARAFANGSIHVSKTTPIPTLPCVVEIVTRPEGPVISSTQLASGLAVKHKSLIETIRTYHADVERFGLMPFETAAVKQAGGRGKKTITVCYLNENQALFVGSLSRNTPQVVQFKVTLVTEFDKARKAIREAKEAECGSVAIIAELKAQIKKLEAVTNKEAKLEARRLQAEEQEIYQAALCQKVTVNRERHLELLTILDKHCDRKYAKFERAMELALGYLEKEFGISLQVWQRKAGEGWLDCAERLGYFYQLDLAIRHYVRFN